MEKSMDRELLRRRLEEKYGKPIVFVTELVYCPNFKTLVPNIVVEARREMGEKVHRTIQNFLLRLCSGTCEAEKQVEIDIGDVVLVGHVDFINHNELRVYEIKPAKKRTRERKLQYLIQLSIYTAMVRRLTGKNYTGHFIWYKLVGDKAKIIIEKPLAIYLSLLDELSRYSRELAKIFGERRPFRVFGPWCAKCTTELSSTGFSKIRWFFNNGFLSVEVVP